MFFSKLALTAVVAISSLIVAGMPAGGYGATSVDLVFRGATPQDVTSLKVQLGAGYVNVPTSSSISRISATSTDPGPFEIVRRCSFTFKSPPPGGVVLTSQGGPANDVAVGPPSQPLQVSCT